MNSTTFFKTSDFKGLSQYPEDIPAKIRITSSEEIHLITVTKYFTI